jgi:hypothetical protein
VRPPFWKPQICSLFYRLILVVPCTLYLSLPYLPACSLNGCEIGALRRTPHGMMRGMCREWLDPCLNQNQHDQQVTGTYDWRLVQQELLCPAVRVLETSDATDLGDEIIQTLYVWVKLAFRVLYFDAMSFRGSYFCHLIINLPCNLSATLDDKLSHSLKQKNSSASK